MLTVREVWAFSSPDLTERSSPSVQREAHDQLAACNFAVLSAT